jgi:hypothetical protein
VFIGVRDQYIVGRIAFIPGRERSISGRLCVTANRDCSIPVRARVIRDNLRHNFVRFRFISGSIHYNSGNRNEIAVRPVKRRATSRWPFFLDRTKNGDFLGYLLVGGSWFHKSRKISHEPSGSFRRISMNLPLSFTGVLEPGGIMVTS